MLTYEYTKMGLPHPAEKAKALGYSGGRWVAGNEGKCLLYVRDLMGGQIRSIECPEAEGVYAILIPGMILDGSCTAYFTRSHEEWLAAKAGVANCVAGMRQVVELIELLPFRE